VKIVNKKNIRISAVRVGKKYILCSDNPMNESGFRPWKICLGSTQILYDDREYPLKGTNGVNYDLVTYPDGYPIFDPSKVEFLVNQALNDWMIPSCYPNFNNDKCHPCPLRVRWTRTERDMDGNVNAAAVTYHEKQKPVTGGDCQMDCSSFEIRLNGTTEWTGINPNDLDGTIPNIRNFFKTDSPQIQTGICHDLRSVLRHEIGHWLGFGHPIDFCGRSGSIMYPGNFGYDKIVNIDEGDKCMFYILYCCPTNAVSVNEDEIIRDPYIYPHPAHQSVNISLSSTIGKISMIEIRDILGQTLLVKTIEENMNDTMITLSIGGLSAGKYHIIQLGDKGMVSHPLVKY
jgi:hypothetical protein